MHLEVFLAFWLDHVKELLAIFLVNESIIEDAIDLMAPQADQLVRIPQMGAGNFKLFLLINFKLSNTQSIFKLTTYFGISLIPFTTLAKSLNNALMEQDEKTYFVLH